MIRPQQPFGYVRTRCGEMFGEEDLWQRHKAEREVWSGKMLVALERG